MHRLNLFSVSSLNLLASRHETSLLFKNWATSSFGLPHVFTRSTLASHSFHHPAVTYSISTTWIHVFIPCYIWVHYYFIIPYSVFLLGARWPFSSGWLGPCLGRSPDERDQFVMNLQPVACVFWGWAPITHCWLWVPRPIWDSRVKPVRNDCRCNGTTKSRI